MVTIDAKDMHYKEMNDLINQYIDNGEGEITLKNINGQRYIGAGIKSTAMINIEGVPGNDMGAFMDGLTLRINDNVQDELSNTMNDGKIIVNGSAGDVLGYAMRGGRLYIKGNVGYRVGIHMKEYYDIKPIIVVGGKAQDFFGEYMAGGILIVLGEDFVNNKHLKDAPIVGNYLGTGMHGGTIYLKGKVEKWQLGAEVGIRELDDKDNKLLDDILSDFSKELDLDYEKVREGEFTKLIAISKRPYGKLYAY